jgi:hypothetical protein
MDESRAQERHEMDKELHAAQLAKLSESSHNSSTPRAKSLTPDTKGIREAIRDSLQLRKDFLSFGEHDMVDIESANIQRLKKQLADVMPSQ